MERRRHAYGSCDVSGDKVRYRVAIDKGYCVLDKNRPEPTKLYLKYGLEAIRGRYPILPKQTEAVGCLMNR